MVKNQMKENIFFVKKGRDFALKEGKKIGSVLEAIHFQQKI